MNPSRPARRSSDRPLLRTLRLGAAVLAALFAAAPLTAQEPGTVTGRVTQMDGTTPLEGVNVSLVEGTPLGATGRDGRYSVKVPAGAQVLRFEVIGHVPREVPVTVRAGATVTVDTGLQYEPLQLAEIRVTSVSRWTEDVIEAPAAVSVVESERVIDLAPTGQTPRLVSQLPGVHAAQSGIFDYNLNTRGFNTLLNRRVLVLVDGRDPSLPLLGNMEWSGLPLMEDGARVEMVRGPGSALYGANAFSGVLNIVTPPVRETPGTRISLGGGELETFRADGRHAGVTADGRWGYRLSGGYYRSRSWDRSRTNLGDLAEEYGGIDGIQVNPPAPGYEVLPLNGQTKPGNPFLPGPALGEPDPVETVHATGRVDWYGDAGEVLTLEGGGIWARNQVFTSQLGRSQVHAASRPWARVAWRSDLFTAFAYYTGRDSDDAFTLATGAPNVEHSGILHVEAFRDGRFADDRGRYVLGGSARSITVDSRETLLSAADDGRSDEYYALFGQLEFDLSETAKVVMAARWDENTLVDAQFSPKMGLVLTPNDAHSFRVTVNRAFQTPSPLEYFISLPGGLPLDLTALEAGLRASPLGPALAGVPEGTLYGNSAAVPLLARGNRDLKPVKIWGYEAGWKGRFGDRTFVTADAFYSRLEDFLTNLLPGVNPTYAPWTAPNAVPEQARAAVEEATFGALGSGITRLPGSDATAFVLSIGNAGEAQEWGLEFGIGHLASENVRLDANYTWFDSNVEAATFAVGDSLLANTPNHRANLAATWDDGDLRVRGALQLASSYDFLAGVNQGKVPSSQLVEASVRWRVNSKLSVGVLGTNLFDQRRYQVYGGSIIGRRILASLTWEY